MKNLLLSFLSFFIIASSGITQKSVNSGFIPVDWLSGFQNEITIGSDTYKYSFFNEKNEPCKMKIIELITDKKGETEEMSYLFHLSDIDKNTISFDVSGKTVSVQMNTKNSQKFITVFEGSEMDDYSDEIEINTNEVDMAREMVDLFKEKVPECTSKAVEWGNYEEVLDWLQENITEVTIDDDTYRQNLRRDEKKNWIITLNREHVDDKGDIETYQYIFNITDINSREVVLDVSGKELVIELPVKENDRLIKVIENGEIQNYENELVVRTLDIDISRDVVNAFKFAISNAKEKRKEWNDITGALQWLQNNIVDYQNEDELIKQSFSSGKDCSDPVTFTSREEGESEIQYEFYLSELNKKEVGFDVSGTEVSVNLEIADKVKLIQVTEDGQLQNYEDEIEIFSDGIEHSREVINAFNYILTVCDPGLMEWPSVDNALKWISDNIVNVKIDEENIEQSLEFEKENNHLVRYTRITNDEDESTREVYEFYLADVNKEEISIDVSGNEMTIEFEIKERDDYIKYTRNDETLNNESEFQLFVDDSHLARNIIKGFKFAASEVKNREININNTESAFKILSSHIGTVPDGDDIYEQEFTHDEGDICKVTYKNLETDSKGDVTEMIYEFSLSDINPKKTEISVAGSIIEIEINTKNGQDLIKPYENGEVENFTDSFEILTDDIQKAREISAALEFLTEKCGD